MDENASKSTPTFISTALVPAPPSIVFDPAIANEPIKSSRGNNLNGREVIIIYRAKISILNNN